MHNRKQKVTLRGEEKVGFAPAIEKFAKARGWKVHRQSGWSDADSDTMTEMLIEQDFADAATANAALKELNEAIAEASTIAVIFPC